MLQTALKFRQVNFNYSDLCLKKYAPEADNVMKWKKH